jgi:enamine deaminase RidA (YjgF/YER057c/UK114 family)
MSISRIEPGPRMSQAVIHGDTIYLAGRVAENAAGGSVGDQTRDILAGIDVLLAKAGSDKTKLLMVNIWLTDMNSFDEMNAVWESWVPKDRTPGRATVEARLAGPEFSVEIAVIAAR